jgi:V/A-type H+-transporting ATPase subunit I
VIALMKKVYVVLLESEKVAALKALGKLGVLHLEPRLGQGPEFEEARQRIEAAERAIGYLGSLKPPKEAGQAGPSAVREFVAAVNSTIDDIRRLQDEAATLTREIERIESWGDFDPELLASLAREGIAFRLFEGPAASRESLPTELRYLRLAAPKGMCRIACLVPAAQSLQLPAEFVEFLPPAKPLASLKARAAENRASIEGHELFLARASARLPELKALLAALQAEHRFESFRSGMDKEGQLCHLKGYLPVEELPALLKEAAAHGWGVLADDPADDETPPTKVKNSALVRIIQPVFDFLGTTPGYREYDISAWFLLFFCLFFAMIFGDAGYGGIMLAGGLIAVFKALRAKKPIPDMIRLLLLLAGSTIAYGAVTGTWFGLPTAELPAFLRALMIPALAGDNPTSPETIKVLCFALGTIQISIAHIKNIIRDFPDPKFLAQVGWLSAVLGLFWVVLNLVLDPAKYPIPEWALIAVAVGFFLVFLFGSWNGNLWKSFLAGLGGLLTQFLGTVSALADIISYIRLFAVGLAGVAISQTVNDMGGGALGSLVGAFAGVLILVFGHTLNLAMSVLSVIVHGVRLNMLEFSGHLGMEWAGYKYEPFTGVAKTGDATAERSET